MEQGVRLDPSPTLFFTSSRHRCWIGYIEGSKIDVWDTVPTTCCSEKDAWKKFSDKSTKSTPQKLTIYKTVPAIREHASKVALQLCRGRIIRRQRKSTDPLRKIKGPNFSRVRLGGQCVRECQRRRAPWRECIRDAADVSWSRWWSRLSAEWQQWQESRALVYYLPLYCDYCLCIPLFPYQPEWSVTSWIGRSRASHQPKPNARLIVLCPNQTYWCTALHELCKTKVRWKMG